MFELLVVSMPVSKEKAIRASGYRAMVTNMVTRKTPVNSQYLCQLATIWEMAISVKRQ